MPGREGAPEELSRYDSGLAVEALEQFARCDPSPVGYAYQDIGIRPMKAARANNGGKLSRVARRCMDYLGAIGCFNLDEEVGNC